MFCLSWYLSLVSVWVAKWVPSRGLKQATEGRGLLKITQGGCNKEKALNVQHDYHGQDTLKQLNKLSKWMYPEMIQRNCITVSDTANQFSNLNPFKMRTYWRTHGRQNVLSPETLPQRNVCRKCSLKILQDQSIWESGHLCQGPTALSSQNETDRRLSLRIMNSQAFAFISVTLCYWELQSSINEVLRTINENKERVVSKIACTLLFALLFSYNDLGFWWGTTF